MPTTILSKVAAHLGLRPSDAQLELMKTWWKVYNNDWNDPSWLVTELEKLGLDFDTEFDIFWRQEWSEPLEEKE